MTGVEGVGRKKSHRKGEILSGTGRLKFSKSYLKDLKKGAKCMCYLTTLGGIEKQTKEVSHGVGAGKEEKEQLWEDSRRQVKKKNSFS